MEKLFGLLVIFQIKHFLADYPLQTPYMLGKFKGGLEWISPLALHSLVHALFTLAILLAFAPSLWALAFLDFTVHFIQDRIKASPNLLGRFKPDNKFFWWALGQDQMVHHLTHYIIIWLIIK